MREGVSNLAMGLTATIAVAVLLAAGYGGFVGWGWWVLLPLAAIMAVNKANYKAAVGENQLADMLTRAAVNFPVVLVFVALSYGVGSLLSNLIFVG